MSRSLGLREDHRVRERLVARITALFPRHGIVGEAGAQGLLWRAGLPASGCEAALKPPLRCI
jgi:hypothetical protein